MDQRNAFSVPAVIIATFLLWHPDQFPIDHGKSLSTFAIFVKYFDSLYFLK